MKYSQINNKMGVAMGVALDVPTDVAMGATTDQVLAAYTGQKDQETLVDKEDSIFCEFTNLKANYCCFGADC